MLRRFVWQVLVFNPLIVGGTLLVFQWGISHWALSFVLSWTVANIVSAVCMGLVSAVRWTEESWAKRRGKKAQDHHLGWYMMLAAVGMVPGLLLAFQVVPLVAGVFAVEVKIPTLGQSRLSLFMGGLILVIAFLWYSAKEAKEAAQKATLAAKEAETQRLHAQLSALAAQMNPHLLFNALNTVASLIAVEPERAEETLLRLAELYRGVLGAAQKATHPLADELKLCQSYLDVERARFGDRLLASVVVDGGLSPERFEVPVLLLQPLVENAVKHGISGKVEGGRVEVRARPVEGAVELSVEDDGVGLGQSTKVGAGAGLSACKERLRLRYQDTASFDISPRPAGGTRVVLRLPVEA